MDKFTTLIIFFGTIFSASADFKYSSLRILSVNRHVYLGFKEFTRLEFVYYTPDPKNTRIESFEFNTLDIKTPKDLLVNGTVTQRQGWFTLLAFYHGLFTMDINAPSNSTCYGVVMYMGVQRFKDSNFSSEDYSCIHVFDHNTLRTPTIQIKDYRFQTHLFYITLPLKYFEFYLKFCPSYTPNYYQNCTTSLISSNSILNSELQHKLDVYFKSSVVLYVFDESGWLVYLALFYRPERINEQISRRLIRENPRLRVGNGRNVLVNIELINRNEYYWALDGKYISVNNSLLEQLVPAKNISNQFQMKVKEINSGEKSYYCQPDEPFVVTQDGPLDFDTKFWASVGYSPYTKIQKINFYETGFTYSNGKVRDNVRLCYTNTAFLKQNYSEVYGEDFYTYKLFVMVTSQGSYTNVQHHIKYLRLQSKNTPVPIRVTKQLRILCSGKIVFSNKEILKGDVPTNITSDTAIILFWTSSGYCDEFGVEYAFKYSECEGYKWKAYANYFKNLSTIPIESSCNSGGLHTFRDSNDQSPYYIIQRPLWIDDFNTNASLATKITELINDETYDLYASNDYFRYNLIKPPEEYSGDRIVTKSREIFIEYPQSVTLVFEYYFESDKNRTTYLHEFSKQHVYNDVPELKVRGSGKILTTRQIDLSNKFRGEFILEIDTVNRTRCFLLRSFRDKYRHLALDWTCVYLSKHLLPLEDLIFFFQGKLGYRKDERYNQTSTIAVYDYQTNNKTIDAIVRYVATTPGSFLYHGQDTVKAKGFSYITAFHPSWTVIFLAFKDGKLTAFDFLKFDSSINLQLARRMVYETKTKAFFGKESTPERYFNVKEVSLGHKLWYYQNNTYNLDENLHSLGFLSNSSRNSKFKLVHDRFSDSNDSNVSGPLCNMTQVPVVIHDNFLYVTRMNKNISFNLLEIFNLTRQDGGFYMANFTSSLN